MIRNGLNSKIMIKTLKYLGISIRILYYSILIYFINKQSGIATAIFAFLMILYITLNDYIRKQHTEILKEITKIVKK